VPISRNAPARENNFSPTLFQKSPPDDVMYAIRVPHAREKNERPQMRVKISRAPAPPHIREKILAPPRTGIRAPAYTRKNPRVPTRLTRAHETPPHAPKTPSRARKSRRRTRAPAHAKTRTRAHTHARLFFPGFISKISSSARTRKKSEQFDLFQTLFKISRTYTRPPTHTRTRDSRTRAHAHATHLPSRARARPHAREATFSTSFPQVFHSPVDNFSPIFF